MLHTHMDGIICILWSLTYTLVLIGTEKYKYPVISPITQLIIAPLEFSVLYQLITINMVGINHVFISYLYWALIEILIIASQIKHGFVNKQHALPYLFSVGLLTVIMCYLVVYKGYQLFFCLFNTFVGEIIWLRHIHQKDDYPMSPIMFVSFLTKFVADVICIPVYLGRGSIASDVLIFLLATLDFMFIHVYFSRIADNDEINTKQANSACFKRRKQVK